jgi:hypothetical protein
MAYKRSRKGFRKKRNWKKKKRKGLRTIKYKGTERGGIRLA